MDKVDFGASPCLKGFGVFTHWPVLDVELKLFL